MPLDPNSYYDIPGLPLFQPQPYTPDQIRFLRDQMPSFLESPSQGDVANLLERWGYPLQSPSFGDFSTLAGQQRQAGTGGFAGKGGGFFQSMLGNVLANFATGGLYGTAKGLTGGDPWEIAAAGAAPMSPGGAAQINTEVRGPQSTVIAAGGALAGAGLAGAFGGAGVGPEGIPYLTDASGAAGQQVLIDPVTGAAMPGATLTPAQLTSLAGASSAAGFGGSGGPGVAGGSSAFAPLIGAQLAQQLYGMFNVSEQGQVGQAAPDMGARPATQAKAGGGAGGPIGGSALHPGLAPRFEQRQKGAQESPGLADPAFAYSPQQYQQMMMR